LGTNALHSVSVSAVITNEVGDVLMIQRRDNGHWEPPGGVLEPAEDILTGLHREVAEETGLDITEQRLTGVYKNMPRGVVALVFRASVAGPAAYRRDNEASAIAWLRPDAVASYCDEAYAVRISDALTGQSPAVRAHDGVRLLAT
jgi:8-oxo-dGTP pyrophosphatase MutT (NUDIX family)